MTAIHKLSPIFVLLLTLSILGCSLPPNNYEMRNEARLAAYHGELEQARDLYAAAAENEPNDALAQYELGKINLKLGKPEQAQFAFEKAYTIKREDKELAPKILDGIAESLFQQDRIENLTAFLARQADYYGKPRDYIRQAKYLTKSGAVDEAIIAYKKAAHFAPAEDPTPYLAIADFYESLNDVENTITSLRYAYYINPKHFGLADKLRSYGIVPGPTIKLEPPKPAILR
ncbi:Tetratricopeptide repeat protein [Poriferisphaera corsica]|uniref:Tetratricopeptide repeat protein n=1 Tax=Poriferisphaera corsica TaxID=2528020 RepID=A0A517YW31_9BACT|nr:hypothetical protein [Poriferisphaera corsica]QDU34438.1 Tetratricopeptide repeat protein [Poriferisphaera corsica]